MKLLVSVSIGVSNPWLNLCDHIRNTEPAHLQADVTHRKYLLIVQLDPLLKLPSGDETKKQEEVAKEYIYTSFDLFSFIETLEDLRTDGDRLVGGFGHFNRRFSGETSCYRCNGCHAFSVVLSCETYVLHLIENYVGVLLLFVFSVLVVFLFFTKLSYF